MQAKGEHSAILSTFIKLPFVIKFSLFLSGRLHRFYCIVFSFLFMSCYNTCVHVSLRLICDKRRVIITCFGCPTLYLEHVEVMTLCFKCQVLHENDHSL